HAALRTRTKMFCDSPNDPLESEPNKNVCPVCLGHPGTLPVPNRAAILAVIRVGLALGGEIAPRIKFDRKNYFYPDLPKGYQISQYDEPIVGACVVHLPAADKDIRIRRVHLEEDAGRLVHEKGSTLVDFNRAGVPLMELVTEPDFSSAEEVVEFARYIQALLRYLHVSDADMEKGQLRVEANISVCRWVRGKAQESAKVEVKNLNSFRAVQRAIAYEIARQEKALKAREKVVAETRGWDEARGVTVSQRSKEEAHDYRYFPEPDITPIETASLVDLQEAARELPELPFAKRLRFQREYHLASAQADALVYEPALADFYEQAVSELKEWEQQQDKKLRAQSLQLLFNYLTSDLRGLMRDEGVSFKELRVAPAHFAELIDLIVQGKILSRQAKDILKKMLHTGELPSIILEREGLHTVRDAAALDTVVREVLQENPKAVADYRKGKTASVQFLVGKAMAKLKGRGDPNLLRDRFCAFLDQEGL
ncbi:Asp-tRNA(Asn)/Glu-tRNA(Gln) amidotransferase subunit GatB, partial [Candidatus Parcubacteria bacterium]